jgi:hypothetical protein
MSTGESTTKPIEIEGNGKSAALWQTTKEAWSFGSETLVAPLPPVLGLEQNARTANSVGPPTVSPRKLVTPSLRPVASPRPRFGKRAFAPTFQWEGFVEEVNGDGFRARLVAFGNGGGDIGRVEYADFAYDDLADESDRELVTEGAVFYWTVGKARNFAGTITNVSLVRFRRLPPPTLHQRREARREVAALMGDSGTDESI